MAKYPLWHHLVKGAQLNIKLSGQHLDDYSSYKSRHNFTAGIWRPALETQRS